MTQNVALLPNGRQQFLDGNGDPIVGGTVGMYIPATLTPSNTYQDINGTILNANPLTLDDLGSAAIWGSGAYRQIVKDSLGNVVWDANTFVNPVGTYTASGAIVLTWTGTQTDAGLWLGGETIAVAQNVLQTAPGSSGVTPKTLPTDTYVITIKQNDVSVGTATMIAAGGPWVYSWPTQIALAAEDDIDFYGSGDTTIADFGITLKTQIA